MAKRMYVAAAVAFLVTLTVTGGWHNDLNGMLNSFQLAGISNQVESETIASLDGEESGGVIEVVRPRRATPGSRWPRSRNMDNAHIPVPAPAPIQTGLAGYANEVLNLTNAERRRVGLHDLAVDNDAMGAAALRARELERLFAHARPDGRSWDTVLSEFNVSSYHIWGENLLYNHSNSAAVAVSQWMNSPGHRANILNGGYTHIGVGAHQSGGRTYVVQIFIGR